jgi:hypothetical protein
MAEHFVSGLVLRSDVLDLELDVTSSAPRARLLDQTTGRVWGPVPLAALTNHDRTLRREDRRAAGLKALHDLCIERFGHLISEEMTHCDLSIKGVVQTRFADGTHVVADYSTHELLINDQAIECPSALMPSPSQVASNMAPPAVLAGA